MPLKQANRFLSIGTPLDDDVLLIKSIHGQETLGRLFHYDLELFSEDFNIDFDAVIGQNVTVRLELANETTRYFNGFINNLRLQPSSNGLASYRATMVPWLWFLTQSTDCRIFQNKSVPDIIKEVFRDFGFTDFEEALNSSYKPREYCVQYRETAFNFISRLMEKEGIYYYFKHENGKHSLVLCDSNSVHRTFPGYDKIAYRPYDNASALAECIRSLNVERSVLSGSVAQNDYDFKMPRKNLHSEAEKPQVYKNGKFEIFDYPGAYTEFDQGEAYSKVKIEELHAKQELVSMSSDARGIHPGCKFALEDFPRKDQNRQYLTIGAQYSIESDEFGSGDAPSEQTYQCQFNAIDFKTPYRSESQSPQPFVQGPQTAVVVGKSGEEIWTDEFGRVKVQFHWDRESKADENSSCWVRVSQAWAGKQWGAIYIPRIGQEVIVEFLEGDPDQPIITGRVYNGVNKPPYDLPAEKTKSTMKSNSSKGGKGFNEIRFEDKKGEEQIFIHAEKDQDTRIKNDAMEWIGNDRHLHVIKDQKEKVDGDKHSHVVGDRIAKVDGDDNVTVMGDYNEKTTGVYSLEVVSDIQQKSGANVALEGGQDIHIKAGMKLVLEAGMQLTLKVGGSFVAIGPAGVDISGPMVKVNSGGSAGSGAGSSPNAPDVPVAPKDADDDKAGAIADSKGAERTITKADLSSKKSTPLSPAAASLKEAAKDGKPFCEKCEQAKQAAADGNA